MEKNTDVNDLTLTVLESIFKSLRNSSHAEIFDASVYIYSFVVREKIYPSTITDGFFAAMSIISNLDPTQFLQIKQLYK